MDWHVVSSQALLWSGLLFTGLVVAVVYTVCGVQEREE